MCLLAATGNVKDVIQYARDAASNRKPPAATHNSIINAKINLRILFHWIEFPGPRHNGRNTFRNDELLLHVLFAQDLSNPPHPSQSHIPIVLSNRICRARVTNYKLPMHRMAREDTTRPSGIYIRRISHKNVWNAREHSQILFTYTQTEIQVSLVLDMQLQMSNEAYKERK